MRITRRLRVGIAIATIAGVAAAVAVGQVRARRGPRRPAARVAARAALGSLAAGDVATARRLADTAVRADPAAADARFVRAWARAAEGDVLRALDDLEACAAADPGDPAVCLEAGLLVRQASSAERADRWFREAAARASSALARRPGDARAATIRAASLVALGRLDEAEHALDAAEPASGAVSDDHVALRAAILVARARGEEARALLARRLAERPSRALAAMLADLRRAGPSPLVTAVDAYRRGDVALARLGLLELGNAAADDLPAVAFLAATLAVAGTTKDVAEAAERAGPVRSAAPPFLLAHALLARGDAASATALFRTALDRAPADPAALEGAVFAALRLGDTEGAARMCRDRLARDGDPTGFADFLLGAALEQAGDDAGAESNWRAALAKDPGDWAASERLAGLLLAQGDVAGTAAVCEAGLAREPGCLPLAIRRADAWLAAGETLRAVVALGLLADANPACAAAQLHAARALVAAGDDDGAARRLATCVAADPDCVDARVALLTLARRRGRLDDATASLTVQVAERPRDPVPRFALGVAAELRGEAAAAERRYREALALAPEFGIAANNLAWLLADGLGRVAEARPLAETAGRLLPRNPHALDTRGWVRFLAGDAAGAEPDLARARRVLDRDAALARRHARVLEALGRGDEAASARRRADEIDAPPCGNGAGPPRSR